MDLLLNTPALTAYEQMALDETCALAPAGGFRLRFYRWADKEAVTFGYAQPRRSVLRQAAAAGVGGPAVRRPTGGGMVLHRGDLTFSCILQSEQPPAALYARLHGAIRAELAFLAPVKVWGKTAPQAYLPAPHGQAGACFLNPVENDLLAADGHKILGGAIRRFGRTVLYQGSLQIPGARENPALKKAVITAVRREFAAHFAPRAVGADTLAQAKKLAQTRYQSEDWNGKFE